MSFIVVQVISGTTGIILKKIGFADSCGNVAPDEYEYLESAKDVADVIKNGIVIKLESYQSIINEDQLRDIVVG